MTAALETLSLAALRRALDRGETSSAAIVEACLGRIRTRESSVLAWAHLDPGKALAQARARDTESKRGRLHGLPVAIKDVFETAEWPTEYGSAAYAGHRPVRDAAVVALFKAAGAVILGKTVTTEFAAFHPNVTRNPHNPEHTPGGSSSGSAAAVADFMAPAATGTQTMGSVIRPASYCGIVGFKPSFGLVPTAGVQEEAPSLDTIGFLVRAVDDLPLLMDVAAQDTPGAWDRKLKRAPRFGLLRGPAWSNVEPATEAALARAAAAFARAGATIDELAAPPLLEELHRGARTVLRYEAPRMWAYEIAEKLPLLSKGLQDFARDGLSVTATEFVAALRQAELARAWIADALSPAGCDAFLTAAAPGEAPRGLGSTGAAVMNQAWTFSHSPCLTLPCGRGPNGLPVGVQLVGARYEDAKLIAIASWAEAALAAA